MDRAWASGKSGGQHDLAHPGARPQAGGRLTRENVDGIEYLWYATLPYQGNGARRLLNMLQFSARLYELRRDLGGWRPDIVIASSTHPYDVLPAALWPARPAPAWCSKCTTCGR